MTQGITKFQISAKPPVLSAVTLICKSNRFSSFFSPIYCGWVAEAALYVVGVIEHPPTEKFSQTVNPTSRDLQCDSSRGKKATMARYSNVAFYRKTGNKPLCLILERLSNQNPHSTGIQLFWKNAQTHEELMSGRLWYQRPKENRWSLHWACPDNTSLIYALLNQSPAQMPYMAIRTQQYALQM